MRKKFMIMSLIFTIILFANSAWPDFGSFSGNSDYSTSRSSSSSSSSRSNSFPSTTPSSTRTRSSTSSSTTTPLRIPVPRTTTTNNYGITSNTNSINNSSSDEGFDEISGIIFVLIVAFIFWLIIHRKSKKNHKEIIINESIRILRPMNEYLELDPEFDEERIQTLIANLYVQMQNTWQAKNISSLRPYMTDKFFSQMDRQLDEFRKMGRTDYTERISVLSTDLRGWRQSAGMDYITVGVNSRIVSYTLDDRTGKLISGDMNREKFMEYEIELCRKSGMTTQPESENIHTERCPHCGAPLKLNASAQCEYCGSVITTVNTDWAICNMRGISQRTA